MIHAIFELGIYDYEADIEFAARLTLEAAVAYLPAPGCDSVVVLAPGLDPAVVQAVNLDLSERHHPVRVQLMIYAQDVSAAVGQLVALDWRPEEPS